MESASNLHHYLEDQLVGSSSSSSSLTTTPSCYEVGSTSTHGWSTTPSIVSTNHDLNLYSSETLLNPRQQVTTSSLLSSQYSSMSPDLSYQHWSNFNTSSGFFGQDSQQSRIKEEISDRCYLKYKDILTTTTSPSSSFDELSLKNHHQKSMQPDDVMGSKFLLKSFSSGNLLNKINNHQLNSPVDHYLYSNFPTVADGGGRGSSQIFPSVNILSLNQMGLTNSSGSFEQMNLQALDLLTSSSSRFSGAFSPSSAQIGMSLSDGFSYGFDHMHQQSEHQLPLYGSSKASASSSKGVAEVKRNSSKMEPKAAQTSAPKKSRLEPRASCPPFKVRKEKLGDRVAALQQLVAPFGKTDTASVLMEAIGYIKFLQSQVETLSVPYMKASRNNTSRAVKGGATGNENHEESKRDLKSRGLCLVPLSCLSYITECGGAAVWPPSHFGGAT